MNTAFPGLNVLTDTQLGEIDAGISALGIGAIAGAVVGAAAFAIAAAPTAAVVGVGAVLAEGANLVVGGGMIAGGSVVGTAVGGVVDGVKSVWNDVF